jgi:hypothetical protein
MKYRTLRPATVHEIRDISDTPPVHEIQDISSITTLQPHPVAHASKDFMRGRPPEDVDIDTLNRQPSHQADEAETQTLAQPPAREPHSERGLDERHIPEGLMAHVADVIEKQLRNLDEAKEATGVSFPLDDLDIGRLSRTHRMRESKHGKPAADVWLRKRLAGIRPPVDVELEVLRVRSAI